MGRQAKSTVKKDLTPNSDRVPDRIQGEPLHPLRTVERVLTRPDGTTLRVEVPVYPPFQLKKPTVKSARARKSRRDW